MSMQNRRQASVLICFRLFWVGESGPILADLARHVVEELINLPLYQRASERIV